MGEVLVVDDPKELSGEIEKEEGDASWNPLAQNTERDIKIGFQANLQQSLVVTAESKDTSKWRWWVLISNCIHTKHLLSSLKFCKIKNSFDFIVYTTGGCSIHPL